VATFSILGLKKSLATHQLQVTEARWKITMPSWRLSSRIHTPKSHRAFHALSQRPWGKSPSPRFKAGKCWGFIEVNAACRHIDFRRVTVSLQDITQIQIKRCNPKNGLQTLFLKHAPLGDFYSSDDLYRSSGIATAVNVSPILAGWQSKEVSYSQHSSNIYQPQQLRLKHRTTRTPEYPGILADLSWFIPMNFGHGYT